MDATEIRALRDSFQDTQAEFARRLGLDHRAAVCRLESGDRQARGPLLVLLRLLARLADEAPWLVPRPTAPEPAPLPSDRRRPRPAGKER